MSQPLFQTPISTPGGAALVPRLLIIDDNTSIHQDIRKILGAGSAEDDSLDAEAAALFGTAVETARPATFEIDSAFQGQEGLLLMEKSLAEGRPYAVAFVDVRMPPGWDGVETISRLWKVAPDLQVVICTAYSDYSWEEMIRKLGKTDSLVILKKPFDNIEVLQLAHTLSEKWALSHRLRAHVDNLDRAVAARTAELQASNARLRQEIWEREQAQRELDQSEDRFAKAFQSSPIPMAIQSLSTQRYLDVNGAFLGLTGFPRLEIIGRSPTEVGLIASAEVAEQIMLRLRDGHAFREFACEFHTKQSQQRECSLSAETIALGTDQVALVVVQDVSEQRRLESQLRQSQKLEAVGQLAAGVAHDFNNILTIIQGHATMQLAAGDLDGDLTNSLDQISLAAERAAALTRQLLAFSRKQIVLPRSLSIHDIFGDLKEMLGRLIGEHIDLRWNLALELPEIYADESNVEQIVMNLVVNARDAIGQGGRVTISTAVVEITDAAHLPHPDCRPGTFVQIAVADNGCGMNQQTLNHIFEPFFTTKEVGKGTGLGLATVYGIVAQHEGWIDVKSEVGVGTTFFVHLPVAGAFAVQELSSEVSPARESAEAAEVRGGSETVLLVEDEEDVREVVTDILETHGYRVFSAADGPEALELWSRTPGVDLLVTDMLMPNGLRGDALAGRLLAEKPSLKVIYSSGYSREVAGDPSRCGELCHFLEKPYKLEDLLRAVRDCLDGAICGAN